MPSPYQSPGMAPGSTNPEKVKRAAAHPKRPGEECKAEPGAWAPRVDRARCEGKRDCVEVCPYGVFEVRIDDEEYRGLPLRARIKLFVHGKQTSYTPGADACRPAGAGRESWPLAGHEAVDAHAASRDQLLSALWWVSVRPSSLGNGVDGDVRP